MIEEKELEYPYNLIEYLWNEMKSAQQTANTFMELNRRLHEQLTKLHLEWLPRDHFELYKKTAKRFYEEAKKAGVEIPIKHRFEAEILGLDGEKVE